MKIYLLINKQPIAKEYKHIVETNAYCISDNLDFIKKLFKDYNNTDKYKLVTINTKQAFKLICNKHCDGTIKAIHNSERFIKELNKSLKNCYYELVRTNEKEPLACKVNQILYKGYEHTKNMNIWK